MARVPFAKFRLAGRQNALKARGGSLLTNDYIRSTIMTTFVGKGGWSMTEANISDAEWQVMEVIWPRKAATAAEVIAALAPQTGWQHRTVRTLLARLVEKDILAVTAEGNATSTGHGSPRTSACVKRANRFWIKYSAATRPSCSSILSHPRTSPPNKSRASSNCSMKSERAGNEGSYRNLWQARPAPSKGENLTEIMPCSKQQVGCQNVGWST